LEERIEEQLGREAPDLEISVLSHPSDRARIRMLLGVAGGQES